MCSLLVVVVSSVAGSSVLDVSLSMYISHLHCTFQITFILRVLGLLHFYWLSIFSYIVYSVLVLDDSTFVSLVACKVPRAGRQ